MTEERAAKSTLHFLPWCRLDRDYAFGDIRFTRFDRTAPGPSCAGETWHVLSKVHLSFRERDGEPVSEVVVVHTDQAGPPWQEPADDRISDLLQLVTFAALAERDYFQPFDLKKPNYSTSTHFARIRLPYHAARRKLRFEHVDLNGLRQTCAYLIETPLFIRPLGCNTTPIAVNTRLVEILTSLQQLNTSKKTDTILDAIIYFNMGCSVEHAYSVEAFVLLASAFERALGVKGSYKTKELAEGICAIVERFAATQSQFFAPSQPRLSEWMLEFHALRGSLAHGNRMPSSKLKLCHHQHICIARIMFPLLIKLILKGKAGYRVSEWDVDRLSAVSELAGAACCDADSAHPCAMPSVWRAHMDSKKEKRSSMRLREEIREQMGCASGEMA